MLDQTLNLEPNFDLALPDLEPISSVSHEDLLNEYGSVSWTEKESAFDEHQREDFDLVKKTETVKKRVGEECASNSSVPKPLSKETISLYYHMPIAQAANELNIGLTLLKKKCRDLGIQRWPRRKRMSIRNLIKNFEEKLEKGEGDADEVRNDLVWLKKEEKRMEESPDLEYEDKTKRCKLKNSCSVEQRMHYTVVSWSVQQRMCYTVIRRSYIIVTWR